ncbi:hypothetical protein GF367_04575 [Candidatus Woesearchaeota archaeon]|nr:hypothetical protein [Candidatus Woesearchaeota archaeon]
MEIRDKTFLERGKRGVTYTGNLGGEQVLVKRCNPAADVDTIKHEAVMLQHLNKYGIGPRFVAYEDGQLVREFVAGERIEDFLGRATAAEARSVMLQSLQQCKKLDDVRVNKFEMTHPYKHILVDKDGKVTMIDFERCKHSEKPKNVTQFCQYVARLQPLLAKSGLSIDGEQVKELGKQYKRRGYDEGVFKALEEVFL